MAQGTLRYPDLTAPTGWSSFSLPPQVRLVPPGTSKETARATMLVSPIVPRTPAMPPPDELIRQAIAMEVKLRLDIVEISPTEKPPSDHGLDGAAVHLRGTERESFHEQRRIYVIYFDERFLYGINFLGFGAAYDEHLDIFWKTARTIRPFRGRVLKPTTPPIPILD